MLDSRDPRACDEKVINCVWSSVAQERRLYRQEPMLSRNGTEPSRTVKYSDALDVRPCVGIPTPSTCTG
ncbi:hypothetical protein CC80DRAFT_497304 [Byssothecium circinans]|uniref:Uncharacterized protein n=1 Tax=Byssothecium circinans TaxID=147558 RepID=A0A6A5T9J5_9PLEO|nr:hypothetical protein CC80DRAFT_497304 [Byssothecium circinans]